MRELKNPYEHYGCGDILCVREDLKINKAYNGISFVSDMAELRGKQVTIKHHEKSSTRRNLYRIFEDGGNWWWTDDMFCSAPREIEVDDTEDFKFFYEEFIHGRLRVQ